MNRASSTFYRVRRSVAVGARAAQLGTAGVRLRAARVGDQDGAAGGRHALRPAHAENVQLLPVQEAQQGKPSPTVVVSVDSPSTFRHRVSSSVFGPTFFFNDKNALDGIRWISLDKKRLRINTLHRLPSECC